MLILSYITWDIDPIIFKLGFLKLRWYSLMFLLSFYFEYKMIKNISLQEKHDVKSLDFLLYYLMTGTIIGARLGHCLFYDPSFYLNNPLKILAFWEGGLASHGGALGIILSTIIYCRK